MSTVIITERKDTCRAIVNGELVQVKYNENELLTGIVLNEDFGFILFEVSPDLYAIPTLAHFVPISENECAALGNHNSTDGGDSMILTDFLGYQDASGNDIYEDVHIKLK